MPAQYFIIHPENPQENLLEKVVNILKKDGVIIIPTDTIYALACDINSPKAIDKVALIKGKSIEKANFSFLFTTFSQVAQYTLPIKDNIFVLMKQYLPGPYTFILNANSEIPKIFRTRKKTIGVRIPDNKIVRNLVQKLGNPLMSTSLHDEDTIIEYLTDPEIIYEKYKNIVDCVIDGGPGKNIPSTIIDCSSDEPIILREGLGKI